MKKIIMAVSLVILCLFTSVYADTNGVWVEAKDIRVGTFGSDESISSASFIFENNVIFNDLITINGGLTCSSCITQQALAPNSVGTNQLIETDSYTMNNLRVNGEIESNGNLIIRLN